MTSALCKIVHLSVFPSLLGRNIPLSTLYLKTSICILSSIWETKLQTHTKYQVQVHAKFLDAFEYSRKAPNTFVTSIRHSFYPSILLSLNPSIRQSVTPSIRQSVTPSNRQSVTPSIRQSVTPSIRQSFYPSIRHSFYPHVSTQPARDSFSWNLMRHIITEACRETRNLVKIEPKIYWTPYLKL